MRQHAVAYVHVIARDFSHAITARAIGAENSVAASQAFADAYSASDTDGDGLPDGFETAVLLDPTEVDSDCDFVSDGAEWPIAGLPVSDPLVGPCTPSLIDLRADLSAITGSPSLSKAKNESSTEVATSVLVRIRIAKYGSAFSVTVTGPGTCNSFTRLGDAMNSTAHTFYCNVSSISPLAISQWNVDTSNCTVDEDFREIGSVQMEIISADQHDPIPSNNLETWYGDVCAM